MLISESFAASSVRMLSSEEIQALQNAGAITPLSDIPVSREYKREVFPTWFGRGRYGRYYNSRK